ncbi:MAG: hypothetical protein RH917_20400 [Lacipirellulaceae bacterium]
MTDRGDNSVCGHRARRNRPTEGVLTRWLSVEQIRKQQRMRRETVVAAMLSGALPFEQRGRIRYARVSDVEAWEESRLAGGQVAKTLVHPALAGLG